MSHTETALIQQINEALLDRSQIGFINALSLYMKHSKKPFLITQLVKNHSISLEDATAFKDCSTMNQEALEVILKELGLRLVIKETASYEEEL